MAETLLTKNLKGTYGTMYYVKDMKASVSLFKNTLGLSPHFESDDWTEFSINGHSICLHSTGPKTPFKAGGTLIMRVTNIREVVSDLKKRDLRLGEVHEVHPGAFAADFTDSDGNSYSLYEGP